MISRVVVGVHVAVMVFAAGIAVYGLRDYDKQTVTGASTSLRVTGTVQVNNSGDVVAQLERLSGRSGVTIAKLDFDVRGADRSRLLVRDHLGGAGPRLGQPRLSRVQHSEADEGAADGRDHR